MHNYIYKIFHFLLLILIGANNIVPARTFGYDKPFQYRNRSGDAICPPMAAWPAVHTKSVIYRSTPLEYVIIHHTLGVRCFNQKICSQIVKNIQEYSMEKINCLDIKYNYLIGEDGNVYEGTGWIRPGCHTEKYDDSSIGIAFIGDFTEMLPNRKALENAKRLIYCAVQRNILDRNYKLYGGKQLDLATKSPGLELFNQIQKWKNFVQTETK